MQDIVSQVEEETKVRQDNVVEEEIFMGTEASRPMGMKAGKGGFLAQGPTYIEAPMSEP